LLTRKVFSSFSSGKKLVAHKKTSGAGTVRKYVHM
jgi:hypothetical protein